MDFITDIKEEMDFDFINEIDDNSHHIDEEELEVEKLLLYFLENYGEYIVAG